MLGKILVVDDEPSIREMLGKLLVGEGYSVMEAHDGDKALAAYKQDQPDVVLLDIRMPGKGGMEVLEGIIQHDPDAVVIMTTAVHEMDTVVKAMELGALDYLVKPINPEQLIVSVGLAIKNGRLKREAEAQSPDDKGFSEVDVRLLGLSEKATEALGGTEIRLQTFPFKIGRLISSASSGMLDDNHLYIEDAKPFQVSRHHCAIIYSGGSISVVDRGSTMGTTVNKKPLGGKSQKTWVKLDPGVHSLVLGHEDSTYRFSLIIEEPSNVGVPGPLDS